MALDKEAVDTPRTPEWWMVTLAKQMLDRDRLRRFGILEAYRAGCPPLVTATESQQRAFHAFNRVARSNFARPVVRAPAERMSVRAIRTAAAGDEDGDEVAWRYWTGCGLDEAATDVHSDLYTFSAGVIRTGTDDEGNPIAIRRDPRYVVTAENPRNPQQTDAALELLWDEYEGVDYAILSLRGGEQWVATRERKGRPRQYPIPGITAEDRRLANMTWFPHLTFDAGSFTMRPLKDEVPVEDRDGGLYSETFAMKDVSIVTFPNRDGVGEFEEHLDLLDCISFLSMLLMVTAGVQAYKQRSLEQDKEGGDQLPDKNPETGEKIDWDEIFQPGPDALWKLPPGVTIKESGQVDLQGLLKAIEDKLKHLSSVTATPFSLFSPDGVNQSAEGAQLNREGLVFKVEDRETIAGRRWARVVSQLFAYAPDADRYAGEGPDKVDRADAGRIVFDWKPAERYSLAEKAQADSQNKSLSNDMAAQKIWGLSADEVEINKAQRTSDTMVAAAAAAQARGPATA